MFVSIIISKIYLFLRNPIKSIPILKQCKRISDLYKNFFFKRKCYKCLSSAFLMISKEEIALRFAKKYLLLSWATHSIKNEMLAYDMIGLLYYYSGDIYKAKYYHNRMVSNILEDNNSNLKKINQIH